MNKQRLQPTLAGYSRPVTVSRELITVSLKNNYVDVVMLRSLSLGSTLKQSMCTTELNVTPLAFLDRFTFCLWSMTKL